MNILCIIGVPRVPNLNRGWDSGHRQVEKDDIGCCKTVMEGICQRAGILKKRLEQDKRRVLRRMESLEHDTIINHHRPAILLGSKD